MKFPENIPNQKLSPQEIFSQFAADHVYSMTLLDGTNIDENVFCIQFVIPYKPNSQTEVGQALTAEQNQVCAEALKADLEKLSGLDWYVTTETYPVVCIKAEQIAPEE